MPARSQAQQRLFGMVHAYKKGKLKNAPEKVKDVAEHISDDDAEHFAKTKHEGLPEKKAESDFELNDVKEFYNNIVLPTKARNAGIAGKDYDGSNYRNDFIDSVNIRNRTLAPKDSRSGIAGLHTGQFELTGDQSRPTAYTPGSSNVYIDRDFISRIAKSRNESEKDRINQTIVHELTHAQNFDVENFSKGRGTSAKELELADAGYGFLEDSKNAPGRAFYRRPGISKEDGDVSLRNEQITTNREYRYKLFLEFKKKYGRAPTHDEFVAFVRNIPAEEYGKFLYVNAPNAYTDRTRWVNRGADGKLVYNYDNIEKTRQANMRLARRRNPPLLKTSFATVRVPGSEKKAAINIGHPGMSLSKAKKLFGAFSKEELPVVKSLIRGTGANSAGRLEVIDALRQLVRQHKWNGGVRPGFLRTIASDAKAGNPHIFRGVHNPSEALHLTGNNADLSFSFIDTGRPFRKGTDSLRHFTPWPRFARTYTIPGTGMHKNTSARFGSLSSYRAKDFPEIIANVPNDGFSQQYGGLQRALFRSMPKDQLAKKIEKEPWLDWAVPGKTPRRGISETAREDIKDIIKGKKYRALKSLMLKERVKNLSTRGPLDQLTDKYISRFAVGDKPFKNEMYNNILESSLHNGELGNYLHEMVLNIKGVKPASLIMTSNAKPGTYYDATRLMKLYQDSFASNPAKADLIGKLFRKRFDYKLD